MASIVKWRTLVAIVLFAEAFTLAGMFGLPAIQGRVSSDTHFPRLMCFTRGLRAASFTFTETSLCQQLNRPLFGFALCSLLQA